MSEEKKQEAMKPEEKPKPPEGKAKEPAAEPAKRLIVIEIDSPNHLTILRNDAASLFELRGVLQEVIDNLFPQK